jgi:hypothetical protein
MNVKHSRLAVALKLEMVMLKIGEAVAHILLASPNLLFPNHLSITLHADGPSNVGEVAVNHKFRT